MSSSNSTTGTTPLWLRQIGLGCVNAHNALLDCLKAQTDSKSDLKELEEIKQRAAVRTDISDHLVPLFVESLSVRPRLIVELGVRGGESTFVFERVARLCNATLVSVDLEDCSKVLTYEKWLFVKSDDIEFARKFSGWCQEHNLSAQVDLLFIDTSHLFEHTLQEMNAWFPFLSERAKVFFHDTNQRRIYLRKDGSLGVGWNNNRGVIKAIETYFQKSFCEEADFVDSCQGWLVHHQSRCSGFTMLTRIPTDRTPDRAR